MKRLKLLYEQLREEYTKLREENEKLKKEKELALSEISLLNRAVKKLTDHHNSYIAFLNSLNVSDNHIMGEWCKMCKHCKEERISFVRELHHINIYGIFYKDGNSTYYYCDKHLPEICKDIEFKEIENGKD